MGMSATQARYLNLQARQSDLEFQGQQINQSRTTLSDQTNNLYSQLQNMEVPTPPVTSDYTTIVYNTSDGAVNYTLGMVRPSTKQDGRYNLDMNYSTVGASLYQSNIASSISYGDEEKVEEGTITVSEAELSNYYIDNNGNKEFLTKDSDGIIENGDGTFTYTVGDNESLYTNNLKIGGNTAYTYSDANAIYGDKINWTEYEYAIKHTFGESAKSEDFYYVITPTKSGNAYDVRMYKKEDIPTTSKEGLTAKGYTYETGTYTETVNMDYVDITFDSTGRIATINIPTEYNEDATPTAFKELKVTSQTKTDNAAYEEAMTQYEYKKFQYDKEQTEINAKMSIIQAQDKKLELKLQRLDNERTQITTEMDALDKVINDNIEKSYKTFSG